MLRVHQVTCLALMLVQTVALKRQGRVHGFRALPLGLAMGHLSTIAAATWCLCFPNSYWRHRIWFLPAVRIAVYAVPSFRLMAASGLLRLAPRPGWRGAVMDVLRVLLSVKLINLSLVSAISALPPTVGLLLDVALTYLVLRDAPTYCRSQLLSAPLMKSRLQRLAMAVEVAALPVLVSLPAGTAAVATGRAFITGASAPHEAVCPALLTFSALVLVVVAPLLLGLRWHGNLDALRPAEPGGARRCGLLGAVGAALAAADGVLLRLAAGDAGWTLALSYLTFVAAWWASKLLNGLQ